MKTLRGTTSTRRTLSANEGGTARTIPDSLNTSYGDIQRTRRNREPFDKILLGRIADAWKIDLDLLLSRRRSNETFLAAQQSLYEIVTDPLLPIVRQIDNWMQLRGSRPLSEDDQFSRIEDVLRPVLSDKRHILDSLESYKDMIRRAQSRTHAAAALTALARPVYDAYLEKLERTHTTDHDQTILTATQYLKGGSTATRWRAVVIDEWQDVNSAQEQFVRCADRISPSRR